MTRPNRDKTNIQMLAWQWKVLAKLVFSGRFGRLKPLLRAVEYGAGGLAFAKEDMDLAISRTMDRYTDLRAQFLTELEENQ